MWAMPLPFLLSRIAGLISLAMPAMGLWLIWGFLRDQADGKVWLVIGLFLLAVSLFGRLIARWTLWRSRKKQSEVPGSEYDNITGSGGAYIAIEYAGERTAPALILTHGWGASRTVWRAVQPILARRFCVVTWDLAGHGESGTPYDGDYSIERTGEDLRCLLQLFHDRHVVLVSHSSGAEAVLSLLRDHPELMDRRVAGVALLNGSALSPLETGEDAALTRVIRRPLLEPAAKLGVWFSWLFRLGAWATWLNGWSLLEAVGVGLGPDPSRQNADLASGWSVRTRTDALAKGMSGLLAWDGAGAAAKLSVPVLSVWGTEDIFVSGEAAEAVAREAPFGEALKMENAGHYGPLGQPEAYAAAVTLHAERAFAIARRVGPTPPASPRERFGEPKSWPEHRRPSEDVSWQPAHHRA
jgi:pimeloyl-ACP methyl ester carboxylesterase